jgi:16S rRNA (adenine1518-N6/adenine1519-N6)-dimethyltransferase
MADDLAPKKNLGQPWLRDPGALAEIANCAKIESGDLVVEIGPGLGTLTRVLAKRAGEVVAIEVDADLASNLAGKLPTNVEVRNEDFLQFDLASLPSGYKIVGNIPYFITGKIVRKIVEAKNRPSRVVLLVQKEVARRLAAGPGEMSALSVIVQHYVEVALGPIVEAEKFTPPPKVDSQVVILTPQKSPGNLHLRKGATLTQMQEKQEKQFLRVVKAGFSNRRKKLKASLAGGLGIEKSEAEEILRKVEINPSLRAQNLTVDDWQKIAKQISW